jgi:zinc protease
MIRALLRCAAVLSIAGFLAPGALAQVFNPESFTLANGMQVVVVNNARAPVVTHQVWYRVGSADEPPGRSGIAHFLEHLMFKGTVNLRPGEFSRRVARMGGRDNAFTGFDFTGYFQNVSRDRLEEVMRLESERMANLRLTDAEVNPERDVILEERRQVIEGRPAARLREQAMAALFLNHPYGRPIIGWEHEMRGLTRAHAEEWYQTWYAPNNAVLIVAGDITAAELRPLAERYYGAIAARPVPQRVRPLEPPHVASRRVELRDPRVQQPSWSRYWLAPSYTTGAREHAYPLQVLSEIIGGGASARLYRSLAVDREIAAGIGAWYDPDSLDHGTFGVSASPRPGVEIAALEAAIEAEIARVLTEGVSDDEVRRALERLRVSAIFDRDSFSTAARIFGGALTTGQTVADVEAWPQRIAAVTTAQVNAAARAVLGAQGTVTAILLPQPRS